MASFVDLFLQCRNCEGPRLSETLVHMLLSPLFQHIFIMVNVKASDSSHCNGDSSFHGDWNEGGFLESDRDSRLLKRRVEDVGEDCK